MRWNPRLFAVASGVLAEAERKPADSVLRESLRSAELSPAEKTFVSKSVFAYFRWLGWIDRAKLLRHQIDQAGEFANSFAAKPSSFADADLVAHAVAPWVHDFVRITPALARELQREPTLWLRVRKGQSDSFQLPGAEAHPIIPDAFSYQGEEDLFHTREFQHGQFEIQDLSSQIVGHVCAPKATETWWDACAGEGGKTLHLCDLMENKGTVWASDPAEWRLKILKRRAARAQLFNYRVKPWAHKDHLPTRTKFDGILVDAPCSGIGTWGRNPHARWTTQPKDILELATLQRELLSKVADSLRTGGKLIYSVCTLAAKETTEVADFFQTTHPKFQPLSVANPVRAHQASPRLELLPQHLRANGMFIAVWQRT